LQVGLTTIVMESKPIGTTWSIYHWGGENIKREITAVDTTIVISGKSYYPCIVVEEYNDQAPDEYWTYRRYFAKDVGLIKIEDQTSFPIVIKTRNLVEYFINN